MYQIATRRRAGAVLSQEDESGVHQAGSANGNADALSRQDATDSRHNESVVGGGKNDIPAGIKRYTYHLSLLLQG
jgi:hypothetical protein